MTGGLFLLVLTFTVVAASPERTAVSLLWQRKAAVVELCINCLDILRHDELRIIEMLQ